MEPLFNSQQKILDFRTLLELEQAKESSDLFNPTIWQDLNQLAEDLNSVDTPDKIALTILRWCSKYPQINQILNQTNWAKVRCDMDDESETDDETNTDNPPIDILENKYEIQRIIKDNQPNNPENNSPS
ncbi:hypothetical protein [Floridanema evergladense]|uniref:Uncharacterized protein n=1 Tax=Floridaenema evergladense BLCC-F167 TaxID=3153639 RepID=A0ABV4WNP0_9CYAN